MAKINLARLKRALRNSGGNYTIAARLHKGISGEAVRLAVLRNEALKEFRNAGKRGLKMKIANPELRRLAEKYPSMHDDFAMQEMVQALINKRLNKHARADLGMSHAGFMQRVRLIGRRNILGTALARKPKTTIKITSPELRKIAMRFPHLWRQIVAIDTLRIYNRHGNIEKTSEALGLKPVTIFKRLRIARKSTALLMAELPKEIFIKLKLR